MTRNSHEERLAVTREQEQFLEVLDRAEAASRWAEMVAPQRLEEETVPLEEALGRVLASDIFSKVDVPGFDRANVDGFAVRAEDTFTASETARRALTLIGEPITPGRLPDASLKPGTAMAIATGAMLPRGADAVLMVEMTTLREDGTVDVRKPTSPGSGVTFAGTDIARGECVLRKGTLLSARETGVLAAMGCAHVPVVRRPVVAIVSTGDELIEPGCAQRPGTVFDSNQRALADAVRELGGVAICLGIVGDQTEEVDRVLGQCLAGGVDLIVMSGGTSKGAGDVCFQGLARQEPGIAVHGVALKPGKPLCLGGVGSVAVAILPGFPTSAIFTFHEFVAPRIRHMLGLRTQRRETLRARLPTQLSSERGRTEYMLVHLVEQGGEWTAYPMGKGSGSVTSFSRADGYIVIPGAQEFVETGEAVDVELLTGRIDAADLTVVGSHCVGLDLILGEVRDRGFSATTFWVGSQGGLLAAGRGECDVAGIHLLDPLSGVYNEPFLPDGTRLCRGYTRMQAFLYRQDDTRFADCRSVQEAVSRARQMPDVHMIHRNRGSGTRVLIDRLLGTYRPAGFAVEARSHNAVAAAISQGRADWGIAITSIAPAYGLAFIPLCAERYDFAIPAARWDRPAVRAFREALDNPRVLAELGRLGLVREPEGRSE